MTLAVVRTRAIDGLDAPAVLVEVHLANGLPSFTLVGLADTEVKEARERVRAALAHSGLGFPNNKRITVNLAPADLPKESGRFDLPIALGILAAAGQIDTQALDNLRVCRRVEPGRRVAPGAWRLGAGPGGAPRRRRAHAGPARGQRQRGRAGRGRRRALCRPPAGRGGSAATGASRSGASRTACGPRTAGRRRAVRARPA